MMTYPTEDKAYRRAETLRRTRGIWTGCYRVGDGWRLLYDPDAIGTEPDDIDESDYLGD